MADGASFPGCSCFWFMTSRSIYGISIDNLRRLGNDGVSDKNRLRDLTSLPPFPSDFSIDRLPEMLMNPLIHDSKLFLFCGSINNPNCHLSSKIYQLSFHDNNILRLSEAPPSSIPRYLSLLAVVIPLATLELNFISYSPDLSLLCSSLFGNQEHVEEGFWVLDGARKEWRTLKPPLPIIDKTLKPNMFFFFKDKIFSDTSIIGPSIGIGHYVSVYNRGTGDWDKANYGEYEKMKELASYSAVVSLPHQKSVAVSLEDCTYDQRHALRRITSLLAC